MHKTPMNRGGPRHNLRRPVIDPAKVPMEPAQFPMGGGEQ
jgi:hypothetical protein